MDWATFFVVSAGASATLVGLLFIGVQIDIERFGAERNSPWSMIARSTYTIFALLFLGSFIFLIPSVTDRVRAQIIVGISVAGVVRTLLSWKGFGAFGPNSPRLRIIMRILPLIGYGLVILGSVRLIIRAGIIDEARELITLGFWFLYAIGLRNSWSLLFDIHHASKA